MAGSIEQKAPMKQQQEAGMARLIEQNTTAEHQQEAGMARLIMDRRSIRLFKPDPVSNELIMQLLNVAIWAPTHGNRQPWRFQMYRDEGRRSFANAVMQTYSSEDNERNGASRFTYFTTIPVHLIVVMREDPRQKQWDEDYAAASCLIQNFQLAAWEQELGVVWKTNPYIYNPIFRDRIGIQPGERIVGVLHIGYPESIPAIRPRTPAEELIKIVYTSEEAESGVTAVIA